MLKLNNKTVGDVYKANIQYGSPNLLKNSNILLTSKGYGIGSYQWDERPVAGTYCTLTFCCKVNSKDDCIGAYQNNGYNPIVDSTSNTETIVSKTFQVIDNELAPSTSISFFHKPQDGDYDLGTYVKWAVVTLGKDNPVTSWIPAASEFPQGVIVPEFTDNILLGTRDWGNGWLFGGLYEKDGKYNGLDVVHGEVSGENTITYDLKMDGLLLKPNTIYTLSFSARGSGKFLSYVFPNVTSKILAASCEFNYSTPADTSLVHELNESWERHYVVFQTLGDMSGSKSVIPCRLGKRGQAEIWIAGAKIEEGYNINPIWTPNINEITTRVKKIYRGDDLVYQKFVFNFPNYPNLEIMEEGELHEDGVSLEKYTKLVELSKLDNISPSQISFKFANGEYYSPYSVTKGTTETFISFDLRFNINEQVYRIILAERGTKDGIEILRLEYNGQ